MINEIYENETLINIDMRNNKGFTTKVKRGLALCMIKNLDKARQKRSIIKQQWIEPEILQVEEIKIKEVLNELNYDC